MIRCPACSTEAPETARFCPSCGEAISSISQMPTGLATPSVAEAARRRSPSSAPVGRLASSDVIGAGFTPGTVLAERYRIIGLLGHGGMGEVYRADDLKLGQPVALKFLPRGLAEDPTRLERFYAEVRIARQVSHPNVCRVYDVGEIEGQHYLSMEFVDGEDLASLLKRIGRLPADKALDISRELCAGLAAAHDKGVLHRDLKPANVMVDGRGRARITDFGLAVAAGEVVEGEVSGTPAYMAPEQLEGKGASVRSDIYALGLVLYELYTGRKTFEGASFQELKRKHSKEAPVSPSTVSPGFDPVVERVILRCLEKDPARRPASVPQVAAALPGGDPLAAALAAGETPSPEMVAAAGEEGALAPGPAWALLGAVSVTVLIVLLLTPFSTDLGLAPLPKSPDALFDRASEVAQKLGYAAPTAADTAFWWDRQYDLLLYRANHIPSPKRVRELATLEPHPWWFWYRQSPRPMVATNMDQVVRRDDPPLEISGMVGLAVDARGNLVSFRAVPPQIDESKGSSPAPDWDALFHEAGLDPKRFVPSGSKWLPPTFSDARAEWDGSFERQPDLPIHVTAAAYRGKPVYFEVLGPWDRPLRMPEVRQSRRPLVARAAFTFLILGVLAAGVIFARRNLRLGRGDPRGAFRVSTFVLVLSILAWLLSAHHVTDLQGEFDMLLKALGFALLKGAFVWLAYMALEPYVRRRWPDLLISWTRLLSGRSQDPLVGRDVLIGLFFGGLSTIVFFIANGLASFWNVPGMTPVPPRLGSLASPNRLAGWLLDQFGLSTIQALAVTSLLILSWVILRRRWLAMGVAGLVLTLMEISGENILVEVPMALALAILTIFAVTRFGIVALAVNFLLRDLLVNFPLTLDFSRWYSGRSLFLLLVLAGLAFYGFRTSLGGKPAFGAAVLDEA